MKNMASYSVKEGFVRRSTRVQQLIFRLLRYDTLHAVSRNNPEFMSIARTLREELVSKSKRLYENIIDRKRTGLALFEEYNEIQSQQ